MPLSRSLYRKTNDKKSDYISDTVFESGISKDSYLQLYRCIVFLLKSNLMCVGSQSTQERNKMNYCDINSKTIDRWIDEGWEWGIPITHETYENALRGEWNVLLTPTKFVPHDWFGELRGKNLLGLASGGGQQIPIFSALGANCTVLDYSERQCESERFVAEREGDMMCALCARI